ncbi:hypothetical protein C8P66_11322 [Humitalea rosea]|uniref:Uncharacterized protein n=1 Tax=Humitalea rosea TaxID=990373 RepID=A0A2W7II86_9PROT|nr:hypothetical protein C8P66_11322 [Humitalea rosea]
MCFSWRADMRRAPAKAPPPSCERRLNGSEDAVRELMALQEDGLAAEVLEERDASAAAQMVLFEIGDLFFYLEHHRTLSGIQRVITAP